MLNWFKTLSTPIKLAIAGAFLVVVVLIFDATTGYVRDFKNWMFDRKQAQHEKVIADLEAQNAALRKENETYKIEIEKSKVKEQVIDDNIDKVGGQIESNAQAVDKALKEVYAETEENLQPTDAKTRCLRVKEKLLKQNIKSAKELDCSLYE